MFANDKKKNQKIFLEPRFICYYDFLIVETYITVVKPKSLCHNSVYQVYIYFKSSRNKAI